VIATRRVRRIRRVFDMPLRGATLGPSVPIANFPPVILLEQPYDDVTKVALLSQAEHRRLAPTH